MGKRTGKPRGRPRKPLVMPPPIRATPEELARALFRAPPKAAMTVEPPESVEEPENAPRRDGVD